jgi:molybdopterin converting factor small subunit
MLALDREDKGGLAEILVSIRYHNIVADFLGRREESRRLPAGTTLRGLVESLARESESFRSLAVGVDGQVSGHVRLFRNGQAVLDLDAMLVEGDEIRVFPAISGG